LSGRHPAPRSTSRPRDLTPDSRPRRPGSVGRVRREPHLPTPKGGFGIQERYRHGSTIITTNLAYDEWANFLGNKPLVAALLSRLREKCHTVKIDGPSLCDPTG
jgi:IstB-like ATP binding protein